MKSVVKAVGYVVKWVSCQSLSYLALSRIYKSTKISGPWNKMKLRTSFVAKVTRKIETTPATGKITPKMSQL